MGDNKHSSNGATRNDPTAEEVAAALRRSLALREEAEARHERAEETAGEMSRVLKRIAEAIDRNPQSWDALFDGGKWWR